MLTDFHETILYELGDHRLEMDGDSQNVGDASDRQDGLEVDSAQPSSHESIPVIDINTSAGINEELTTADCTTNTSEKVMK